MTNSSNFYAAGLTNFGFQFPGALKNCGSSKRQKKKNEIVKKLKIPSGKLALQANPFAYDSVFLLFLFFGKHGNV